MDRAAELPLQSSAFWPARHSCRRNSQGKNFGCLLAFCLLSVFMLALPVCYLLGRHFSEPQACKAEERAGRVPEFQKQTAPERKPRAHLIVSGNQELACEQQEFTVLKWKYGSSLKSNMNYTNGYLVISKSGDYFVYAQVTFRNHSLEKDNCSMVTHVTQTISRITSGYPRPITLLSSRSSIEKTLTWTHASYLGGVAKLNANDKLLVNVSNTKLVHTEPEQTFFGAFLI
ncbi:tumor necrosis factor ligand superfamily member 15 [Eublepharis macularius]|uniref:Tumor necrosis factor ligand superfamily member 15 n=1 Tax=Eublepharis macularius TaxID=481883 RepID=A0AA97LER5_EUBMA|nr:tumor necrosis factor ligand superfamily member 15 [Eublepharis macularius]